MAEVKQYRNFIAGQFVDSPAADWIDVTNPANGALLSRVPQSSGNDVERAVAAAKAAQPGWAALPPIARAKHLHAIAAKIREHADRLARCITEEQGKILGLAKVEVDFTADYIDYSNPKRVVVASVHEIPPAPPFSTIHYPQVPSLPQGGREGVKKPGLGVP